PRRADPARPARAPHRRRSLTAVEPYCMDPATVGFDVTLPEYVDAAAEGGFRAVEWPVSWATPDPDGSWARSAALFRDRAVHPTQFASVFGVPGNLAVPEPLFHRRLARFPAVCTAGRAVGTDRCSLFVDVAWHGGVALPVQVVAERIRQVVTVASAHGVRVVIGLHNRPLLDQAAAIGAAAGVPFGFIIDTFTLYRHGLTAGFVDRLPPRSGGRVRVGDAPAGIDPGAPAYAHPLLPGRGVLDIRGIVDACRRNGYGGPVSAEVRDPSLRALPPAARARAGYQALVRCFG